MAELIIDHADQPLSELSISVDGDGIKVDGK